MVPGAAFIRSLISIDVIASFANGLENAELRKISERTPSPGLERIMLGDAISDTAGLEVLWPTIADPRIQPAAKAQITQPKVFRFLFRCSATSTPKRPYSMVLAILRSTLQAVFGRE
jgi:hypothetical protein